MARKTASTVTVATPAVQAAPAVDIASIVAAVLAAMGTPSPAVVTPATPVAKAAAEVVKAKKPKVLTPYGIACEKAVADAGTFAQAVKILHTLVPESAKYDKVLVGNHLAKASKAQGEKNAKYKAPTGMPALMTYAEIKAYKASKA